MSNDLIFTISSLTILNYLLRCFGNRCSIDEQCRQFEYNGTTANCSNKHCACFNSLRELIPCTLISAQFIGDGCPCPQSNAFCKEVEDVCYCDYGYMPSIDKLRCIKRAVALNESCELDEQCQQKDFNSICDPLNKKCTCIKNFLPIRNYCRSIIGDDFKCQNNADCFDNYGKSVSYCSDFDKCYCVKDYIVSTNKASCLSASQYYYFCYKDIHCTFNMGLGAKCLNNTCQCIDNYVLKRSNNGNICTKKIEIGQYCLTNDDCYQYQLNDSDQSLRCIYSECQCKSGFYSINNGECQRGSFATKIMPTFILIMFSYILQVV